MNKTFKGIIGAALLTASSAVLAVPTLGGVGFTQIPFTFFEYDQTAKTFDFENNTNANVTSVTGDFVNYFGAGATARFFDFKYDTFATDAGDGKIWEATANVAPNIGTTISFFLDTVNSVDDSSPDQTNLAGIGRLTDGINEIEANWTMTANDIGGAFSWSSSTGVPEPGTLALLGLGLAGLGVARRRQKA